MKFAWGLVVVSLLVLGAAQNPALADELACDAIPYYFLPGDSNYCLATQMWNDGKYPQAAKMFERAASWGSKPAQQVLGVAYFNGEGLDKNRALGLAWLKLSAERPNSSAKAIYEAALHAASDAEISESNAHLVNMEPRYADRVAALRASRHYKRRINQVRSNPVYGIGTCLVGLNARSSDFVSEIDADGNSIPQAFSCSMASEQRALEHLEIQFENALRGWSDGKTPSGEVRVEPVQPVQPVQPVR